jgi:hypothetical protein
MSSRRATSSEEKFQVYQLKGDRFRVVYEGHESSLHVLLVFKIVSGGMMSGGAEDCSADGT